jgi:hypothetical protein
LAIRYFYLGARAAKKSLLELEQGPGIDYRCEDENKTLELGQHIGIIA